MPGYSAPHLARETARPASEPEEPARGHYFWSWMRYCEARTTRPKDINLQSDGGFVIKFSNFDKFDPFKWKPFKRYLTNKGNILTHAQPVTMLNAMKCYAAATLLSSATVVFPLLALLNHGLASAADGPQRIAVRVIGGTPEFYGTSDGNKFTPRGMNYIRLTAQQTPHNRTLIYHGLFNPDTFDRQTILADLEDMQRLGYNTVRVFLSPYAIANESGQFDDRYIGNVADFLRMASSHSIYTILTQDGIPFGRYSRIARKDCCQDFSGVNLHYLSKSGVESNKAYFGALIRKLVQAAAPIQSILSYELRNELYLDSRLPPLSLKNGSITGGSGKVYNVASRQGLGTLIDDGIVYFINQLRGHIRKIDPEALISVGFFVPQGPNQVRVGDYRHSTVRAALLRSSADYINLHMYPDHGLTMQQLSENFGIPKQLSKPIIMGEFGAYKKHHTSATLAAEALVRWQIHSCAYGISGWLLWTWNTREQPRLWNGQDGDGAISRALAPALRPMPCE